MKKSLEVIFNILFWTISYLVYFWIERSSYGQSVNSGQWFNKIYVSRHAYFFILLLCDLIGPLINFYLFYFIFIPKLLVRKKGFLFIILALFSSFIIGYSFRLTFVGVGEFKKIIVFTIMALISGVIGGGFKGIFLWLNSVVEKRNLEKIHLQNKNALLLLKA